MRFKFVLMLSGLCILYFSALGQAQVKPETQSAQTKQAQSQSVSYEEMLQKVQRGDLSVDFKKFRFAYLDTKDAAYDDAELRKKMFRSLSEKNYKDALKDAQEQLKKAYVNLDAHLVASIANRELGNPKEADFHSSVFKNLLESILKEGDGKTLQAAWTVIHVGEEYTVLNALGFRRKSQALMHKENHHYDVLTAVNSKTQQTAEFYFNIDKVWEGYNKLFGK